MKKQIYTKGDPTGNDDWEITLYETGKSLLVDSFNRRNNCNTQRYYHLADVNK